MASALRTVTADDGLNIVLETYFRETRNIRIMSARPTKRDSAKYEYKIISKGTQFNILLKSGLASLQINYNNFFPEKDYR